jgi:adenylate kinase
MKNGTPVGLKAKEYVESGKLVPDDVIIGVVKERLAEPDCANGYILDGMPRTIPQAEALDAALAAKGENVDYAVNIDVPDEAIIDRMSGRRACVGCGATYHVIFNAPKVADVCDVCGAKLIIRDDDKPETVKNRLSVYHAQTQPLIDYYEAKGLVVNIDGTQDMDAVFAEILEKIGK